MTDTQKSYSSFESILNTLRASLESSEGDVVFVGIDGFGASGKSTLADHLAAEISDCSIVRIDDFGDWSPHLDWSSSTFPEQVVERLRSRKSIRQTRYDWNTDTMGDWFEISPADVVIVEGISALRRDLRDFWNLSVWVDCPSETRIERGIWRDGEHMRPKWIDEWMPGEERYSEEHSPREFAAFIFDGSGRQRDISI